MKFEDRFLKGMKDMHAESVGFNPKCQECLDDQDICCEHKAKALIEEGEVFDEAFFSNQECHICGQRLAGDRHYAHALTDHDDSLIHLEVCTDCVMYIANGETPLDDDMEEES